MKEIFPNLYCIVPDDAHQPSAPVFLAVRSQGNLLFGSGANITEYFTKIKKLGGVVAVFIGDRHHGKVNSPAAEYFQAPLCCSKEEAKVMKKKGVVIDQVLDFDQHKLYEDLEVIPTPGHTAGALSYLWTSAEHKVLFIGDTLVPIDDEWRIWVSKKNAPTMLNTMKLLSKLDFNYIAIGSGAVTGEPVITLSAKSKDEMIESVIKTVLEL